MNFQAIKWMVDSLVETFSCPECNSRVDDSCVDVMWTAGQNINVDVICNKCSKHTIIRAQMLALEIPIQDIKMKSNNIWKIEEMQAKLDNIEKNKGHIENMKVTKSKSTLIKDSQIIELNKNLKSNNISMEELFKNQ